MTKYNFSITKGSLLYNETNLVVDHLDIESLFSNEVHTDFIFLPQNSESSRKTLGAQIVQRILSTNWIELWREYPLYCKTDQRLICFYAICCKFELMRDFMLDVYRDKWLNMKDELLKEDIYHFLELKSDYRPELNDLQDHTRSKIVQVFHRTLNEVGLLRKDVILDVSFTDELKGRMKEHGDNWFLELTNMK